MEEQIEKPAVQATVPESSGNRAFTLKAIIAGLIGILLIAGGSKFSSTLANQSLVEHQLGVGIFFYFFLIALIWNPLWSKLWKRLVFSFKEMAVTMVMTLTAGGFAWIGWMKQMCIQSILTISNGTSDTTWTQYKLMDFLNKDMFPLAGNNNGAEGNRVFEQFIGGTYLDKHMVEISKIPWDAWIRPLLFWGVLILLVALMCMALMMVMHRQWVRNEKLTYPLATVAESLFHKDDPKKHFADIFRTPMFWIAFAMVLFIHIYNFIVIGNPTSGFQQIQMAYPLSGLSSTFPILNSTGCAGIFGTAKITFLIIGISYFLAPALSLSVGLNGFVYLFFAIQVYEYTGAQPSAAEMNICRSGAYLAFMIMLIILGRRYYGSIFWKAITWAKAEEDEKLAVNGARVFLLTAIAIVFMLNLIGMDMIMSLVTTLLIIIVYTVFTRIVCEAGIHYIVSPFLPITFFSKLFGGVAIGPDNLMASGQTSGVLFSDMKQLLMPYLANGFKISEDAGVKIRKVAQIVTISIFVAFAAAFTMEIIQYYSRGISDAESKSTGWKNGTSEAVIELSRLGRNEQLPAATQRTLGERFKDNISCSGASERLSKIEPEKESFVWFFLIGFALVFFTGFMRTRFLWWPFHAVIFCIWNTTPANVIWFSFLLGWFIRTLVVKLGGEKNYIRMKPVFLGLIFGEIAASGIILLYGLIYYLATGTPSTILYQV